jgi:hypothetical protein
VSVVIADSQQRINNAVASEGRQAASGQTMTKTALQGKAKARQDKTRYRSVSLPLPLLDHVAAPCHSAPVLS